MHTLYILYIYYIYYICIYLFTHTWCRCMCLKQRTILLEMFHFFLANYTRGDQQEPMGTRPPWPTKPRVYWFLRIKYIYIYNILIWVDTLNIPESSKFNLIVCCVRTTDWIQLATVVTRFVVKALFLLVEAKILMIKAQCLQVAYFGWYFGACHCWAAL